ncbi:putative peptidase [Leifsonia sp. LS1]|uniref:Type 1 glutamine amidotransferase-like domain-containing protein n=1 Tax=Leifsonia sp. LS1 TaxID=2828483 RepID=UPI001CFDBAAC|nr:Type 1 glutamine amidotransferase-like domain-containing protein [Leifsonia sp. LS1]GIT81591.1 putative peptidase [Leifsonia sp. LS1]
MRLLLLSLGVSAIPAFLREALGRADRIRVGYVPDAALAYDGAPFVDAERAALTGLGYDVETLRLSGTPLAEVEAALDRVDALYVAGGNTFSLLHALRSAGADRVIVGRVRAGLPYIGLSAGSVVAGPTIAPIAPMDDATEAPGLTDLRGLGLVDVVVVPHADGVSYPAAVIDRVVAEFGQAHPLRLLVDDEALIVDDEGMRVVASPVSTRAD